VNRHAGTRLMRPAMRPRGPVAAAPMALPEAEAEETWAVSYLDVVLLLLTLFVLLFAWSRYQAPAVEPVVTAEPVAAAAARATPVEPEPVTPAVAVAPPEAAGAEVATDRSPVLPEWARAQLAALVERASPQTLALPRLQLSPPVPAQQTDDAATVTDPLEPLLRRLTQLGWGEQVRMVKEQDRLRVEMTDAILFESGSAELRPQAVRILRDLLAAALAMPMQLLVEGHTDDRPIATAHFPSNWELSAYRAGRVARWLVANGFPADRISTHGFADTRPLAPNDSPERRAMNRRVAVLMSPSVL
jgi:chemotaxis protein MotB